MAQVKYKHGTVRNSRHVVRNLVSASLAMLRTINREDLNEKGEEAYALATSRLHAAQKVLHGEYGLTQEQQVERMEDARDAINEARRAVVATSKAHKDQTSHQSNMYDAIVNTLDETKQHVTAGRQFAKDRRFVSRHSAPEGGDTNAVIDEHTEGDEVADVEVLLEEKAHGLG